MEKPNHSNGKETQNYDPETGKYLPDGESAGKAGEESSPSLSDEELEMYGDEDRKIASAMSKIIDSPVDRMTFLSMLRRMPQDAQDAYADVILGHNKIQPVSFSVKETEDGGCYYSVELHTLVLDKKQFEKYGPSMHYGPYAPFMTLFHELAHAIDFTAKKVELERAERMVSCNQTIKLGSSESHSLMDNALDDMLDAGGEEEFADKLAKKLESMISAKIQGKKEMTYVEASALLDRESGRLCPAFEALCANYGGYRSVHIENPAKKFVTHCPSILKETLDSQVLGHGSDYYNTKNMNSAYDLQWKGSTELFANFMSLMATDPQAFKEASSLMPRTSARLMQMLSANSKIRRNRDEYQKELERRGNG